MIRLITFYNISQNFGNKKSSVDSTPKVNTDRYSFLGVVYAIFGHANKRVKIRKGVDIGSVKGEWSIIYNSGCPTKNDFGKLLKLTLKFFFVGHLEVSTFHQILNKNNQVQGD
jgi:hypothetical protein